MKTVVLGSGGWGTALALVLFDNGHDVTLWSHTPEKAVQMAESRENPLLKDVHLPEGLHITGSLDCLTGADMVVSAAPSFAVRTTGEKILPYLRTDTVLVTVSKGIERETGLRMSQILQEATGNICKVVALSGPSHAEEVGKGMPTTIVAGAKSKETAEYIQNLLMNKVFRVYTSPDMLGIELGGALKNVIALAAGIADGLGCGDNTKAALITRGITEIGRLGLAMGGKLETFCGLTGIGDLIVTCASMHSRNRRAGILIGQGKSMKEAMDEVKQVVEGVYSAKAAMGLAKKYAVEIPIIEQVNLVLFEGKPAAQALDELMLRDRKIEISTGW